MDSSTSLAGGVLGVVFGIAMIMTRKYSYEQAKKHWVKYGFPIWSERMFETWFVIGGVVVIAFGIALIVAALL